jgi:hypothetical protein
MKGQNVFQVAVGWAILEITVTKIILYYSLAHLLVDFCPL